MVIDFLGPHAGDDVSPVTSAAAEDRAVSDSSSGNGVGADAPQLVGQLRSLLMTSLGRLDSAVRSLTRGVPARDVNIGQNPSKTTEAAVSEQQGSSRGAGGEKDVAKDHALSSLPVPRDSLPKPEKLKLYGSISNKTYDQYTIHGDTDHSKDIK